MRRPSTGIHESWNGVEPRQGALFHESFIDAIGAAVAAIGGPKVAGGILFPSESRDSIARAEARVRACLNPERAEKFSPEEIQHLAAEARKVGDHSIMNFLAASLLYEVRPIEPVDAAEKLQRDFIDAVRESKRIAEQLAQLDQPRGQR